MRFAEILRASRIAAKQTQADLADITGVARPNITAYESGRREPRFDSAMILLRATGTEVQIEPPISWQWTSGLRPYPVPSRLWRLDPMDAFRRIELAVHMWSTGDPRVLDLANRADRCRAYEIVLREGTPTDIEATVDGVLLCEAWPDLVLPRTLRVAWERVITASTTETDPMRASVYS